MADEKRYDIEDILNEVQSTAEPTSEEKKPFKLELDLDSEYGEAVETAPIVRETKPEPIHTEEEQPPVAPKKQKKNSWILKVLYTLGLLVTAGALGILLIVATMDFTGMERWGREYPVDIDIPAGASTVEVAAVLKENGLISQPIIFRIYSRLTGADGTWQPGNFSLKPSAGYTSLIEDLQTKRKRATATVTIPEGFTVRQMAERLEKKGVCTTEEFLRAVTEVDYSADYDFIAAVSKVNKEDYDARIYKLEGYLFPDTYDFYLGCSGETVVRKMLDNFDRRLDTTIRASMSAKGYTMDELIVLASIVQGEAGNAEDMSKVSRVLANRMADTATYPKLQCDSTGDYIEKMFSNSKDFTTINAAYDTYEREGLPAGPINNPGLAAIKAVLTPADDEDTMKCYFFATDYKTGKTYFTKTYNDHVRICKKYGIGMYG